MTKLERTLAEIRTLITANANTLPPVYYDRLLRLLEKARNDLEDLATSLSDKDDEIAGLENHLDCAEGETPGRAAQTLCQWARGEDRRVVSKALEAIGGGHASDLSLIFS